MLRVTVVCEKRQRAPLAFNVEVKLMLRMRRRVYCDATAAMAGFNFLTFS